MQTAMKTNITLRITEFQQKPDIKGKKSKIRINNILFLINRGSYILESGFSAGKAFRMTYEKIPIGCKILIKFRHQFTLSLFIKINHYISAKYKIKLPFEWKGFIGKIKPPE